MRDYGTTRESGTSLVEAMIASLVFLIVIAGMLPLIAASLRSSSANDIYTQAANSLRAKMEEVKSLKYAEIGICTDSATCPDPAPGVGPTLSSSVGLGYFETDPFGDNRYTNNLDYLLSDTVQLRMGERSIDAVRKVTIAAVDDPLDGSGVGDLDKLLDINTGAVLDYKMATVTISFRDPVTNRQITQSLATVLYGLGGDLETNAGSKLTGGDISGGGHPSPPAGTDGRIGRRPRSDGSKN